MAASNGSSAKHHASDPNKNVPEGLTLGQFLRSEREKRKLTIEELQERTGIHLSSLHALENDLRQELPADVFVRGFIKLYAKTLEFDPQAALDLFRDKNNSGAKRPESFVSPDVLSGESLAESPLFTRKKLFLFLLFILLGILAYIVYRYQPLQKLKVFPMLSNELRTAPPESEKLPVGLRDPSLKKAGSAGKTPASEASSPPPLASSPPETDHTATTATAMKAAAESFSQSSLATKPESEARQQTAASDAPVPHALTATFSQMTWVRTVIDHKQAKEAFFRPGTSASWQAKQNIEIVLGNCSGVSLVFDGTPVKLRDNTSDKVLRLSFP